MKVLCLLWMSLLVLHAVAVTHAAEFGPAENNLNEFRAIRYENVYTRIPTSGKLVSIKITDTGKAYYICREETGYVIYHLEIRPVEGFQEKIEAELKEKSREWNSIHPEELLLTKQRYDLDLGQRVHKYCEAVWVRNELVVGKPPQSDPVPGSGVVPPFPGRGPEKTGPERESHVSRGERQKSRSR